ncbi:hypothetical protein [Candidatus Amoebophilus asiaticus]|uniref:hypothetical protein n=1 Tax=Candidatus Amoebophilus asiaticus TaxID=281120 RepID=UPI00165050C5|nr:hypothetical protein [Candidatus Amoebophilus asiaticus]
MYLQFSKSQRLIARLLLIVYLLESCQIFNNSPVLQSYKQEHRLSITNSFISKETANLLEDHIVITKQGEQIKFKKTANGAMQATVIENLGGTLGRAYILPIYIDPALRITETTIKNKGWQTQFIHVIDNRVHIAQIGLLGGGKEKEKEGTVIHVTSTTSSQKPLKRNRADKGKEITEKSKRRKLQEEDSEREPTEEEKRVFQLGESMKIKEEPTEKETGPMDLEAITANVDAQYQYEQDFYGKSNLI